MVGQLLFQLGRPKLNSQAPGPKRSNLCCSVVGSGRRVKVITRFVNEYVSISKSSCSPVRFAGGSLANSSPNADSTLRSSQAVPLIGRENWFGSAPSRWKRQLSPRTRTSLSAESLSRCCRSGTDGGVKTCSSTSALSRSRKALCSLIWASWRSTRVALRPKHFHMMLEFLILSRDLLAVPSSK